MAARPVIETRRRQGLLVCRQVDDEALEERPPRHGVELRALERHRVALDWAGQDGPRGVFDASHPARIAIDAHPVDFDVRELPARPNSVCLLPPAPPRLAWVVLGPDVPARFRYVSQDDLGYPLRPDMLARERTA